MIADPSQLLNYMPTVKVSNKLSHYSLQNTKASGPCNGDICDVKDYMVGWLFSLFVNNSFKWF